MPYWCGGPPPNYDFNDILVLMVFAILKQSSLDFRLLRPSGARNDNEKTSLGLKAERGARNDNENWNRDCFASLAMTIIDYCRAKAIVDNLGG